MREHRVEPYGILRAFALGMLAGAVTLLASIAIILDVANARLDVVPIGRTAPYALPDRG